MRRFGWLVVLAVSAPMVGAANVYLLDVPDYGWYAGCFGTACGNLIGYWDRNGFPDFYKGPTNGGIAPLNSTGQNQGIRSLWASQAGFDGRPADQPGHMDDYWRVDLLDFESTEEDPYVLEGRPEHAPDCIGDFIGQSQKKWTNLNGECDGNINGFAFVYWDAEGNRRVNYQPGTEAGLPAIDLQSGLRAWAAHCGYEADVFTQLADFYPGTPEGKGFTFEDLKREIDAGYPVLLFMQESENSRTLPGMPRANPNAHMILAYGYYTSDTGQQAVYLRTSWGSGERLNPWVGGFWLNVITLPVRGVIGFRPKPRINSITASNEGLVVSWDGPSSKLFDVTQQTVTELHYYVVEKADRLDPEAFTPVAGPTTERQVTIQNPGDGAAFFRVKQVDATGAPIGE